jgi:acyl-homoserine lactone acylase PvdQ
VEGAHRASMLRGVGAAIVAALVCAAAAAPAVAQSPVQPYGTNDAGGFLNVLPPGENGLVNAVQLAQYEATRAMPPHFDDQQHLYDDLLYASPTLTPDQVPSYFKDATFGVQPADVASTETPRPDVTIVRDKTFGVPHIYGTTRAGVMFGAGYAGAEDRLFLMDVLRHTARAELSSFAGGSAGNREMDRVQWAIAPYTEADLQSQLDNAPKLYGGTGAQLVDDVDNYVAGINAYIDAALADPLLMPSEYAAIGKLPTPWTPTDVIAEASLIGGIFGKGGGNELRSAMALEAFGQRFGTADGRAAWSDFREKNDPEAPTTVSQPFPYETTSPFATTGLAMPDPGSVTFTPTGPPVGGSATAVHTAGPTQLPIPSDGSIGSALLREATVGGGLESNWELVSARHSSGGHPIAVMGPQVGYYVPQILMEEDLHGPGIDARGAAFPGVNLYVELGHGRDYAWSATTATSDNVDTFAEVLCNPGGSPASTSSNYYLYKGRCLPMEELTRTNTWTPTATDPTSAGSETLTAYRTVHGIVYARGAVNGGTPVAFVSARTTYFHEADSAIGFSQFNDPGFMTSPQQFQLAASHINFGFNWAYVDANHIAYYESGWYPERAAGTSPDFPTLGTGQYDWQGYDPAMHTMSVLPFAQHPNAIDPDFLVSWNNKQAPQWAAADDKYAYGPIYRSQLIADRVKADIAGGKTMNIAQLVQAMEEPATEDIRIVKLWPILKQALGSGGDTTLRGAIALLDQWYADGGHRRDLTGSGVDQDTPAIELMDAWWPRLLTAEFHPSLGDDAFNALRVMLPFGSVTEGQQPAAPDFADGWYGYVSKDLRDLLSGSSVPGAFSRVYCGNGSLSACRSALRQSLVAATAVSPQQLYGQGDCSGNPQPSCFDQNRSTSASAISLPPFPFQNRPTFQQVVQLTRTLPRSAG